MKRVVYLVACLPFWLTSCEEKVTALRFNEAGQVFKIGKESELRFLNETFEVKDKNIEAQTPLADAGRKIPADEVRIKLVRDTETSGKQTPTRLPVRGFDGNGHIITFDGIWVVIEESSEGAPDVGLFEGMGSEKEAVVKNLTLAGDVTTNAQKREDGYSLLAGSPAGKFKNGYVKNCTNKVDVSFADSKGACILCLGKLIRSLDSYDSEVEAALRGKVINEGSLIANPYNDAYIGGVTGGATNYGKIFIKENACVESKGDLTVQWKVDAQPDHNYIGGVVGLFKTNETDIEYLHNWGNVRLDTQNTSATFSIGGVYGELTPRSYERIYPLDLYNAGNIEIKHDLLTEFSVVGGVIGSFGGSSFRQVVNEGRIIVSGRGCKYVSGLPDSESPIHGNCYLYSCCVDKVGTYPVWNISYRPVTKQVPCKESHPTNQK